MIMKITIELEDGSKEIVEVHKGDTAIVLHGALIEDDVLKVRVMSEGSVTTAISAINGLLKQLLHDVPDIVKAGALLEATRGILDDVDAPDTNLPGDGVFN
jgi:hypothetical protein